MYVCIIDGSVYVDDDEEVEDEDDDDRWLVMHMDVSDESYIHT